MARRRRHHKPTRWYAAVCLTVLSGRRVTVKLHGTTMTIPYVSGFSPIVGHTIRVGKIKGKWHASGPISDGEVTIPAGDDAPDPPSSGTYGPIRPIYTGTWRGSRWVAGDLVQGVHGATAQIGAAFYGTGPRVLLRGPVVRAHLTLRGRDDLSVGTVLIRPLAEPSRPIDAPTLVGTDPIASVELLGTLPVTVVLPTTTELTSGVWGGFAVYDPDTGPDLVVGTQADSMTLTMDWS